MEVPVTNDEQPTSYALTFECGITALATVYVVADRFNTFCRHRT